MKSIIHANRSKEERKLSKENKKAETLKKFKNKKTFNINIEKKPNVQIVSESKLSIQTPIGTKKDVDRELPKGYCPLYTEEGWQNWWEAQGYFTPEYNKNKSDETFVMMIPPPNVTGVLHIGHALTVSVEDCIIRWNRMLGKQTLWLPGTDHAGIATQTVVEKKIFREKNLNRHDLGREPFIEEIWKWKEEKGGSIIEQLKQMGSSCDFSRLRFTMDSNMSRAVTETFVRLYDEKLIYRSKRLVNWSCFFRSAISDIEVDKIEIAKRTFIPVPDYDKPVEFGYLDHFAYTVVDSGEKVFVATTRLETMLGDTGLAIHPEDSRYTHLHGKYVSHPFVPNRSIPIVCDTFVDKEFGTGAVKITPAHDHNDYEVGLRHNLDFINIFSDGGLILEGYGEFSGMKRFHARKAIRTKLEELGLFEKTTDNPMVIPMCSKSKDIIEPMIKNQWYVKCKDMAAEALRVVNDGELKLLPEGVHNATWTRWMEDCHDWCISRQLWWGHRIPVYKVSIIGEPEQSDENDNWIAARNDEEAQKIATAKYKLPVDKLKIDQDPDVLDTWFSSQLFPFSTMGWPEQTSDLQKFYPGNLLETGHDIIFFWVSRMVMIGLKMLGKLPFDTVYLHAMIRDAHGKKMSKSLGNVLNPHDVIRGISLSDLQKSLEEGNLDPKELTRAKACQAKDFPSGIPQCGTDALRFALLAYTSQSRDINLDVLRVKGYRNFCNKIWQAFNYSQMFGLSRSVIPVEISSIYDNLSETDKWILSRLSHTVDEINEAFITYNLSAATTSIYRFMLYEFCDVYIEYTKRFRSSPRQNIILQVIYECMEVGLRLLHPMMPFITEELYQRLPRKTSNDEDSIMVTSYPQSKEFANFQCPLIKLNVDLANEIVKKLRSYRKEISMLDKQVLSVSIKIIDSEFCDKFVDDLVLPLSNSKLTSVHGNSLIFANEKMEIYTGAIAESAPSYDDFFICRSSQDEINSFLKQLKLFPNKSSTELETVCVKQWCNWLNHQFLKGKMSQKETFDFVNEQLTKHTYISGHRYPTLADSLLLHYLAVNKVGKAFISKYPNIERWQSTVQNCQ